MEGFAVLVAERVGGETGKEMLRFPVPRRCEVSEIRLQGRAQLF